MFCQNGRINKNYPNAELKESNSVDISRLEMRKRVLQTHPDTQVGHFVPDTVGGTWFWGLLDWGFLGDKYNLTPACNKHDICYSTCGKTQKQCDVQFKKDIYDICRSGGGEHSEYLYYAINMNWVCENSEKVRIRMYRKIWDAFLAHPRLRHFLIFHFILEVLKVIVLSWRTDFLSF